MKKRKIKIYGLRKRWLVNSLSPIILVALLVAVTFCAGMVTLRMVMREEGKRLWSHGGIS